jgi:mRNA interferase YafQ
MEQNGGIFVNKTKHFLRAFKKLSYELQNKAIIQIDLFQEYPKHSGLKIHKLSGKMDGLYAFWVTNKVRIIFLPKENIVLFLDIGTHDEVYD